MSICDVYCRVWEEFFMVCPKCNSTNVTVQTVTTSMNTRKRKMGCLWGIGRTLLIIFTFGLWLIVGKAKGQSKTKVKNKTVCICQNCGNTWYV